MSKYEWTIAEAYFFIYEKFESIEQMSLQEMLFGSMGSTGFIDTESFGIFQIYGVARLDMVGMKCDIDIIPDAKCIELTIPKECIPGARCNVRFRTRPARILIDFKDTNNTGLQPRTEYPMIQVLIETPDGYCELSIAKYPAIPDAKIPFFRSKRIRTTVEFKQLVTWEHVHTWLTENFALDNGFDWADADLTITPIDDTYRDVCDVWIIETDYPYHLIK